MFDQTPILKAIGYARNQREALCRFLTDGRSDPRRQERPPVNAYLQVALNHRSVHRLLRSRSSIGYPRAASRRKQTGLTAWLPPESLDDDARQSVEAPPQVNGLQPYDDLDSSRFSNRPSIAS